MVLQVGRWSKHNPPKHHCNLRKNSAENSHSAREIVCRFGGIEPLQLMKKIGWFGAWFGFLGKSENERDSLMKGVYTPRISGQIIYDNISPTVKFP